MNLAGKKCTWQVDFSAWQVRTRAVAFNALDFRFSKLGQGRAVGGGAVPLPVGGAAAAQQLLGQAVNDWDADDDSDELPAEGV